MTCNWKWGRSSCSNESEPGKKKCREHLRYDADQAKDLYEIRRDAKLCTRCGAESKLFSRCVKCRRAATQAAKRRKRLVGLLLAKGGA